MTERFYIIAAVVIVFIVGLGAARTERQRAECEAAGGVLARGPYWDNVCVEPRSR